MKNSLNRNTQLATKIVPIVVLIVIPAFAGMGMYVYGYSVFNPSINPNSYYSVFVFVIHRAAQIGYLIVITYGLYPIASIAKRLSKNNYESIANHFEFIRKILVVGIYVLGSIVVVTQVLSYFHIIFPFILYNAIFAILAASLATVIGSVLRIAVFIARKEFWFYLAIGYGRISSGKQKRIDKIKYLILSLDSYNKFITRQTDFAIKNIDKICSDIMNTEATPWMLKSINEHQMELQPYLCSYSLSPC